MKRVIIESPYAGDIERNIKYAKRCMWDSLKRGEAPFLSHLLYPQVLDDTNPDERELGMKAGFEWGRGAELTAVYVDYGITPGMGDGIVEAWRRRRKCECREIGRNEGESKPEQLKNRPIKEGGKEVAETKPICAKCRNYAGQSYFSARLCSVGKTRDIITGTWRYSQCRWFNGDGKCEEYKKASFWQRIWRAL